MQTNSYSNNTNNDNTSPLCEANFFPRFKSIHCISILPPWEATQASGFRSWTLVADRQCTRLSWLRSLPECPRSSSRASFCPRASSYIQSTASSTDWTSVDQSEPGRGILASRTASDAAAPHLALCLRRHVPSLRPPLLLLLLTGHQPLQQNTQSLDEHRNDVGAMRLRTLKDLKALRWNIMSSNNSGFISHLHAAFGTIIIFLYLYICREENPLPYPHSDPPSRCVDAFLHVQCQL